MNTPDNANAQDNQAELRYQVRVHGHLSARWAAMFEGMTVTSETGSVTCIEGRCVDQAALQAVLRRIGDLGLEILSVVRAPPRTSHSPHHSQRPTTPQGELS
jgi:hypothetical protein